MILQARQTFVQPHPGGVGAALALVRDPARALAAVRFLRGLRSGVEGLSGELIVPVPVLGEVDLPFRSRLEHTPQGAALLPQHLTGERAWVEVQGLAEVSATGEMAFSFEFRAHLATPEAEGWGGAAFEKMVRAAAGRTLERVARELPLGLAAAVEADSGS